MSSLNKILIQFSQPEFYFKISLLLGAVLLVFGVAGFAVNWLRSRHPKFWFTQFIFAIKKYLYAGLLCYGIIEAVKIIIHPAPSIIDPSLLDKIINIAFALIAIATTIQFKTHALKVLHQKAEKSKEFDSSLVFAADKILTIAILVIGLLITLDTFGVPINTLLAFGGIGGLAISWAAKDVIANFFGGLMIFIHRPFVNGDWINSPNKGFEGTVEHIGWYRTQIRTFERRPAYIPNSQITDAVIQNPSRMYNRRIMENIGLRYEDVAKVQPIVEAIRSMLHSHKDIDQEQIILVHFMHYGAYSLDINIYCFTKTKNWLEYRNVQQEVLLKIATIVQTHEADFAFPTQTLLTPDLQKQPKPISN